MGQNGKFSLFSPDLTHPQLTKKQLKSKIKGITHVQVCNIFCERSKIMLKALKVNLKNVALCVTGAVILAFGLYNIHSVSGVTEGGVLGLTLFFDKMFGISPAISGMILNALCYIIGVKALGINFIFYSAVSGITFSASYAVFERFPRVYPDIADNLLLCSVAGAMFVGVGVGLCVRAGGAPSGDDSLAMSISKIFKLKIQYVYLATDLVVLGLSLIYIPLSQIVYSLLTVVISGQLIGIVSGNRRQQRASNQEKEEGSGASES